MKSVSMKLSCLFLIVGLLPGLAVAAPAGTVLFASGQVKLQRDATWYRLRQGDALQQGDTVQTGSTGGVQLRMADQGLIALRSSSEFRIDEYELTAPATSRPSRSFLHLLKGGLRMVTGVIGKAGDDSAFRLSTAVATIGIRGTTFDVACIDECREGLVFGTSDGSIVVTTAAGSLTLEDDEYGMVTVAGARPRRLIASPPELRDDLVTARDEDERAEAIRQADVDDLIEAEHDQAEPQQTATVEPDSGREQAVSDAASNPLRGARRDVAYGAAPFGDAANGVALVSAPNAQTVNLNSQGDLLGFNGRLPVADSNNATRLVEARLSISDQTAVNLDRGRDPESGLSWGRWGGGNAIARQADGQQRILDLSQQSLHWMLSTARGEAPVMPSSGTRSFSLFGNTDPTDNFGNRGVLGSASLTANFSDQTVHSTLNLLIADQAWSASGSAPLGRGGIAHQFGGDYSVVSIGGMPGEGQFAGFLNGAGLDSAGLDYVLSDPGGDRRVVGVAAFRADGAAP